jgi:hypothetical protein
MLAIPVCPCIAQNLITNFPDVAGKWTGISSRGTRTDVSIGADGTFNVETPVGKDSGKARLTDGGLILPFSDNQGQYKFTRRGDDLEGVVHWRGIDATVTLTRVAKK